MPYIKTIGLVLPEKVPHVLPENFPPGDFQSALATLNLASGRPDMQIQVHLRTLTCRRAYLLMDHD